MKSYLVLFLLLLTSLAQAELPLSIVGTFEGAKSTERKSEERFFRIKITENLTKYIFWGSAGFFDGPISCARILWIRISYERAAI
jgi:hypothetical protein